MKRETLPSLRQRLRKLLDRIEELAAPGFERTPVFPGIVNERLIACGREGCRCQRGEKHRAIRLCIFFRGGPADRSITEEEAGGWRDRIAAYRRVRAAIRAVRRWQKEVVQVLDRIERARRVVDGLSPEDRKRPLR